MTQMWRKPRCVLKDKHALATNPSPPRSIALRKRRAPVGARHSAPVFELPGQVCRAPTFYSPFRSSSEASVFATSWIATRCLR